MENFLRYIRGGFLVVYPISRFLVIVNPRSPSPEFQISGDFSIQPKMKNPHPRSPEWGLGIPKNPIPKPPLPYINERSQIGMGFFRAPKSRISIPRLGIAIFHSELDKKNSENPEDQDRDF